MIRSALLAYRETDEDFADALIVYRFFGDRMDSVIDELNEALAA